MKVLLMDQNLVVPVYRRKWELLSKKPGIELLAVAPSVWIENYRRLTLAQGQSGPFPIVPLPVVWPGFENRSFYLRGVYRILRRVRPDVFIVFQELFSLFALQSLVCSRMVSPGSRLIFYSWDNLSKGTFYPYRPAKVYSLIEKLVACHADYILTANQEAADYFSGRYDKPVRKVYFGIDVDNYRMEQAPGKGNREQKPRFVVGYIGRLLAMKGVDLLIRAACHLPEGIVLSIVGDGPESVSLKKLARDLHVEQRVIFQPGIPASEVKDALGRLDALVLPSRTTPGWKEQYGRILIEAMAAGVPVIGSSSGAIPEVIGDAGIIFPEQDVQALAAAITKLSEEEELRHTFARAGLSRVERFSSERFAASLYEICLELAEK